MHVRIVYGCWAASRAAASRLRVRGLPALTQSLCSGGWTSPLPRYTFFERANHGESGFVSTAGSWCSVSNTKKSGSYPCHAMCAGFAIGPAKYTVHIVHLPPQFDSPWFLTARVISSVLGMNRSQDISRSGQTQTGQNSSHVERAVVVVAVEISRGPQLYWGMLTGPLPGRLERTHALWWSGVSNMWGSRIWRAIL